MQRIVVCNGGGAPQKGSVPPKIPARPPDCLAVLGREGFGSRDRFGVPIGVPNRTRGTEKRKKDVGSGLTMLLADGFQSTISRRPHDRSIASQSGSRRGCLGHCPRPLVDQLNGLSLEASDFEGYLAILLNQCIPTSGNASQALVHQP